MVLRRRICFFRAPKISSKAFFQDFDHSGDLKWFPSWVDIFQRMHLQVELYYLTNLQISEFRRVVAVAACDLFFGRLPRLSHGRELGRGDSRILFWWKFISFW